MSVTEVATKRSFVAGRWVEGDEVLPVENPADETIAGQVLVTPKAEVLRAIESARSSFDEGNWAGMTAPERVRILERFLDYIETQAAQLIETIVAEAGQPVVFAEYAQVRNGISQGRAYLDLYRSLPEEDHNPVPIDELVAGRVALSIRHYEPIGVVAAITPYNATLLMAMQKVIPALVSGNSVVLRPSPLAPLSSLVFGSAAEFAGLPEGVLSVVIEGGSQGAELLSSHPAVDMVSFTGSTGVGRMILAQAAPTVKRVALELGGKSAQIYLPDAVSRAAAGAAAAIGLTAGQACVAATRVLVPNEAKAEVLEATQAAFERFIIGNPTDVNVNIGPVISRGQWERCERYVALAAEHGGKVVTGGKRPASEARGHFFEPTVLDVADNANPAAQEEIFGPVVCVIGYRDLDDAVRIANDSSYGLSGQVYGADVAEATRVARRLRTGAVNVNTSVFSAYASSGGHKQSGLGRERGPEGIRAFQEMKHIAIGELRP
jgi:acyl-CoA reductase-like NAD-dependent aldehyde dehydrogenase